MQRRKKINVLCVLAPLRSFLFCAIIEPSAVSASHKMCHKFFPKHCEQLATTTHALIYIC